mmetsp:Transcript_60466/g.138701  ORF Transcript_60466/g.138701 Transcript_60466/m.138701 type:complete len:430 (+) Transcript_60466:657-1946(+)
MRIAQMPFVHHLQQESGDLAVRLLELVEQQQRVGPPAHRLGQLAALLVAHVARRSAHEARDGVALREFGHVEPGDRLVRVEEEVRERLAQLGLADAGGPDEEEHAKRTLGRLQTGASHANRVGDDLQRLRLAHHLLAQLLLHAQQLALLPLKQPRRRDPRRTRDDLCDVSRRHLLREEAAVSAVGGVGAAQPLLPLRQLAFEPRYDRVRQLARADELSIALRRGEISLRLLQRAARGLPLIPRGALARPRRVPRLDVGLLGAQRCSERGAARVGVDAHLAPQRLKLNLHREHLFLKVGDGLGLRLVLHPQPRGRLVEQVDGRVGQLALGQVAVRVRDGRDKRRVGDVHAVVRLVLVLDATHDSHALGLAWLRHVDRLEAPREGGVLLDLPVLGECRRAHDSQVTASELRLEDGRGIHCAACIASAHHRV